MAKRKAASEASANRVAIAQQHRAWLSQLPIWTGKSRTAMADELKIARTTLTNPLKKKDSGLSTLSATTIEKVVRRYGVPPPGVSAPDAQMTGGFREEAVPFDASSAGPLAAAVSAFIAQRDHIMPVRLRTRAIEGAGYLPGDILIYDLDEAAEAGAVVRAQLYDQNGEIIDTVWRIFDPPFLIGVSRDPSVLPKPLIVDNQRVVITGTVIGMFRPLAHVAA